MAARVPAGRPGSPPRAAVGDGAEGEAPATSLRLALAGPNPTAGRAALAYELAVPGAVLWDGRAAGGDRVPSGVYLARLRTGSGDAAAKIMLVR